MKSSIVMLAAGTLSLAGGMFALLNPLAATLTAELLAGYLFIAISVLMLLSVLADDSWRSRILSLILGGAILAIGVNLVSNPLQGVLQLTVVVALLMLLIGALRITFAVGMPGRRAQGDADPLGRRLDRAWCDDPDQFSVFGGGGVGYPSRHRTDLDGHFHDRLRACRPRTDTLRRLR